MSARSATAWATAAAISGSASAPSSVKAISASGTGVSRPYSTNTLRNKPVAVIGASTGMFGAVWAQAELRKVLASAGARVLEGELPVLVAHTQFDEAGRLIDEEAHERLAEVVRDLVAAAAARATVAV